jgi:hypothetical protein
METTHKGNSCYSKAGEKRNGLDLEALETGHCIAETLTPSLPTPVLVSELKTGLQRPGSNPFRRTCLLGEVSLREMEYSQLCKCWSWKGRKVTLTALQEEIASGRVEKHCWVETYRKRKQTRIQKETDKREHVSLSLLQPCVSL